MFLKKTKSKNHTYLQLVESYRDDSGNVRHRVVAKLGRLDILLQSSSLESIGNKLLELSNSPLVNLNEVEEIDRLCYGHIVYEKLWNKIGVSRIINQLNRGKNSVGYPLNDALFYSCIHRLLRSTSKLKSYEEKHLFYGVNQDIELHHIYQSLDFLAENKQSIEQLLFDRNRDLFNHSIDVAFYDVTTFHFESNQADELREYGFSKAGKFNEVQVVMGLFTDMKGKPIGYELFPGNTFDGKTMVEALKILKERFCIRKVIIVADKGLNSKNNFHLIREAGYEYIVSARIKSMSADLKNKLFNESGYEMVCDENAEVVFKHKTENYAVQYTDEEGVEHQWTDKILFTWSAKRAVKSRKDRQRQVEKAQKFLDSKSSLNDQKGMKRYLIKERSKVIGLNEAKIDSDAQWDGYYGIQFSNPKLKNDEVLSAYHQLWRIEQSFRIMKTTLKTRPIFHWTKSRIEGHFMLCFIAFLLERNLEIKLNEKGLCLSADVIKETLYKLQLSKIKFRDKYYLMKGANGPYGAKVLRALNIAPLKNIQPI
jgi:transposase